MNKYLLITSILFCIAMQSYAQTPCENGMAGDYPCENVDLLSTISLADLGGIQNMNDIWGWTHEESGREFALVGLRNGTTFVEVSDPVNPIILGFLETATGPSLWRDIKVYSDFAFIVSEANSHGMQVFDLSKLLVDPEELTGTFEHDAWYQEFGRAHNIVINESTGFAYGVGTNSFNGGLHFVDITDPLNPTVAGGFGGDGYTHDAQVVNYAGPDSDYSGKEIAFACNEDAVTIIDVTDKTDPNQISTIGYENSSYTHQGWLTEDENFFIVNDELDELDGLTIPTKTLVFDVRDLDNPVLYFEYFGEANTIDHNLYNRGSLSYQSNYTSGLRILDLGNVYEQEVSELGFFDSQPNQDNVEFTGTWSNYAYFPSGTVVMTDMYSDFFILRPTLINSYRYTKICGNSDSADFYIDVTWSTDITETAHGELPDGIELAFGEIQAPGVISITATLTEELEAGFYELPISLLNGDEEVFTETLRLEIDNGEPLAFTGFTPEEGFMADELAVDLAWDAIDGVSEYTITISANPEMTEVLEEQTFSETTYEYEGQGMFYWTVTAINPACGTVETSPVYMFENNYLGVENYSSINLALYPNPAKESLTVEGVVGLIGIYSIDGKLIRTHSLDRNQTLSIADLVPGTYYVRSEEFSVQAPFVKL